MKTELIHHPSTVSTPVSSIEVELSCEADVLQVRFIVEGDIDRVAWLDEAAPERADALWMHTCFEVFVPTADGYREYNVSSSGEWASYRFDDYRDGMAEADERAVLQNTGEARDVIMLDIAVEMPPDATGLLGLSAVIEDLNGDLSYWALAHPSDKPDFHHPDSFVLELP